MIKIIGTHHLMKASKIEKEIDRFNPDIIGVELCKQRIEQIENKGKVKKRFYQRFSLIRIIAKSLKYFAKKEGLNYGSDLLAVYNYSKLKGIKLELVDRSISETERLFKSIPLKEKLLFMKSLIAFRSVNLKDSVKEVNNDKLIRELLEELNKKLPVAFDVLVKSRDEYMVNKIKKVVSNNPNKEILIFVGKAHAKEIEESVK